MRIERWLLCLPFVLAAAGARPASRWLRPRSDTAQVAEPVDFHARAAKTTTAVPRAAEVRRLASALEVLQAAAQESSVLRVMAFDVDGNVIRGVRVQAFADGATEPAARGWTDDEGLVELRLHPGDYTVVCGAPKLKTWHQAISLDQEAEIAALMQVDEPPPDDATTLTQDGFAIDR